MALVKNIINIRNFKGLPLLHDNYPEKQWESLEPDLIAILNRQKPSQSLEEIYRTVESLHKCNNNNKHNNFCETFILNHLGTIIETDLLQKLNKLLEYEDDDFLAQVNDLWTNFCDQMKIIKNIFISFHLNNVQFISLALFRNTVVMNSTIKKRILTHLLKVIENERNGLIESKIDVELMISIRNMLTDLGTYTEVFHEEFERISDEFYEKEGKELVTKCRCSISEYLKYVSSRITEETHRGETYVNGNTTSSMINIIQKRLIGDHVTEIMDAGFEKLIDDEDLDGLTLLFDLMRKIYNGYNHMSDYFNAYVMKIGTEIMNTSDTETIDRLLKFKNKMSSIIESCFTNHRILTDDLRKCFTKFINVQQNRPAQLLAKYVDQKLRAKKENDVERLEAKLDEIMTIFRLIQGKDIFEAFYKKNLAKRLLLGKSTSQDAESSMVSKLKYECGSTFTSKIEGMFNDINISTEINAAFKQHLNALPQKNDIKLPDLSINVLTNSFWPSYPTYKLALPLEFVEYQNLFQKFYNVNHSGRKLLWQPNLGYCILKADFRKGKKELQVSLFQTLVLLLFNNANRLTYSEIEELTNLEETELKRTLISLCCGRSRVLLKKPKGLQMNESDLFMININFADPLFRVKINQIQLKDTKEEEKAIEKSVLIDRQFQIDAAIVRIMKSCKCISHTNLISQLFDRLGIPVKPSDLKKRIELLIEREYMEREEENPSNYRYIA